MSFAVLREARRGDEAYTFRSARTGERLRALLCAAAQEHGPDPTSIGQAPWHQRAGHWALGARRALSQTRASQTVARTLPPASRLYARSRARRSTTAVAGSRKARGLRCLLDEVQLAAPSASHALVLLK